MVDIVKAAVYNPTSEEFVKTPNIILSGYCMNNKVKPAKKRG
jgi:hypothetical protein